MSKKAIPNGDLDFAAMAQAFASTVKKDHGRFEIAPGDAELLDVAVTGPFGATCAGWIEGGSHQHLPGGVAMRFGEFGKPQPQLIDPPVLPSHREEKYSVAVLEVHYQSFLSSSTPALEPRKTRQLEGPAAEEAA
ncbi:MAG: hypothetical protein WBD40_23310 [Tepidisphaeraceae bacterium]